MSSGPASGCGRAGRRATGPAAPSTRSRRRRTPTSASRGRPPHGRSSRLLNRTTRLGGGSAELGEPDRLGDLPAAESLVDRDHRPVGGRVPGVDVLDVGALVAEPGEHGELHPEAEPPAAVGREHRGVLLGGDLRTEVVDAQHRDPGRCAGRAVPGHDRVRRLASTEEALARRCGCARGSRPRTRPHPASR